MPRKIIAFPSTCFSPSRKQDALLAFPFLRPTHLNHHYQIQSIFLNMPLRPSDLSPLPLSCHLLPPTCHLQPLNCKHSTDSEPRLARHTGHAHTASPLPLQLLSHSPLVTLGHAGTGSFQNTRVLYHLRPLLLLLPLSQMLLQLQALLEQCLTCLKASLARSPGFLFLSGAPPSVLPLIYYGSCHTALSLSAHVSISLLGWMT